MAKVNKKVKANGPVKVLKKKVAAAEKKELAKGKIFRAKMIKKSQPKKLLSKASKTKAKKDNKWPDKVAKEITKEFLKDLKAKIAKATVT